MSSNAGVCPRTLRIVAAAASMTAGCLMFSARQTKFNTDSYVHVDYGKFSSYWCFAFANIMAAIYSFPLCCLPAKSQLWRTAVALDAVFVLTLSSSCSAALAVSLIESFGYSHAGWIPICPTFPAYCARVYLAIGIGYVAVVFYVLLQLLTFQEAFNSILVD